MLRLLLIAGPVLCYCSRNYYLTELLCPFDDVITKSAQVASTLLINTDML